MKNLILLNGFIYTFLGFEANYYDMQTMVVISLLVAFIFVITTIILEGKEID